ncbi:MAG: 1-deoxy-D-xylulose-5-phosphate reductoisomerase [Cellulomonadaceae bacterium]|jgi:1-deoxy-D-xylulose-5-phosphate reductoisomerase|nr:1-deoxy-D-xylulose-5-phosphate reductoisomerase [Cellulomonadaceae bacterium]
MVSRPVDEIVGESSAEAAGGPIDETVDRRRSVTILGSTGSIGTQAIDVITRHPDRFRVEALCAGGSNRDLLAQQAAQLGVPASKVGVGAAEATRLAALGSDVVLNGITGSVGLRPTLAALEAGSTLALANKESLVVGGPLVKAARRRPDQIVPVDSEHSAIAQALRSGRHNPGASEVRRIILTASGGPFRGKARADLVGVTPQQALAHPTWAMGPVVTINSATLMNKGLELIEAHLLFDVAPQDITVVVHPQSVVHSMVEFVDGSTIAQASPPDMRLPIALGLSWPQRLDPVTPPCDWTQATAWTFEPLDESTFPAVRLAREAVAASATHPAVYNAANEQAVAAFLAGRIGFLDIVATVEQVLAEHDGTPATAVSLEAVESAEEWARSRADSLLERA